ncbi:polysaccharide deacetylase family protein [Mycobacterium sp. CPCC 205372]|uniref:Polysaccharide deacetylase family protein n=1 Tax=Mycobacterium hippophais TaxID=3016340 RepID=A0ABT4PPV2_9MYCO|nr:polysaccharide deacetylase family protein [Mycobacterium hippophais]MCZ8378600.1 polysaccharide deacetylase family protein [Mycobacterium hippophais]
MSGFDDTAVDTQLITYTPITERPAIRWPGGARVAFYVGLNVEHFEVDRPSTSIHPDTAALTPDPLNYGWRDYGLRVGIWRLIEIFDRHGIRPSVLLNSDVAQHYPQVIRAGVDRGWAWLAHGRNNSTLQTGLGDDERDYLLEVLDTIEKATGQRPSGWLGPALTETFRTPELLADLGVRYTLDWTNDDQPYPLRTPGLHSLPYSVELNDIPLFVGKSLPGDQFVQIVKDQVDQLHADAEHSGRVMALALHPFVTGQPFRARYLDEALRYVVNHPDVWVTTSDEIAAHYLAERG